jgi:hypothetical protein
VRDFGNPTVVSTGIINSSPTITACNPNDVSVVQLRRLRWAHEVSSRLSANMMSSSVKSVCCYGHHESPLWRSLQKKKGRVFTRPGGTFLKLEVSS